MVEGKFATLLGKVKLNVEALKGLQVQNELHQKYQ
jgi:hypothetical protein